MNLIETARHTRFVIQLRKRVLSKQSIGRQAGRLCGVDEAGWLAPRSDSDEGFREARLTLVYR